MTYKCEWCDIQYEEPVERCKAVINRMGVPEVCEGKVKEVLPCPECGLWEYQCRCEREHYEER